MNVTKKRNVNNIFLQSYFPEMIQSIKFSEIYQFEKEDGTNENTKKQNKAEM